MNIERKLIKGIAILCGLYALVCLLAYAGQEMIIFHPQVLSKSHQFESPLDFEELTINVEDDVALNSLLFKSPSPSKGLIFYLHGNAGSLQGWSRVAPYYAESGYDVCVIDYRGFGKSDGQIENEVQFYNDIQIVYDEMKLRYDEKNIVVLGYSIGTGVAAKIAKDNHPKHLILQAPYVSLEDIMKQRMSFLPTFLLKYDFRTDQFLEGLKVPVTLIHGTKDRIIPYQSSLDLQKYLKPIDTLITLQGQEHNRLTSNKQYLEEIRKLLQ